ncbi:autoinducer binding domain-containing protein [Paraburkholderia sp. RL17-337-BIB-A]|uniref:autoinducer binding domain-containing protein n=1 Tax=Paraburkholderia sp. RL17-337-BIB-A TaxID=3031636 RepID=UPI0038BC18C0
MSQHLAEWWSDLFFELQTCEHIDCAFSTLSRASQDLGFLYCAFGYVERTPFSSRNIFIKSSYPESWVLRYREKEYLDIDPIARLEPVDLTPVIWNDELFADTAQLWDEAKSAGLAIGISQPCWDPRGQLGIYSLARDCNPLSSDEIKALRPFLAALAHLSISHISQISDRQQLVTNNVKLTDREIEVLRWTADGKSAKGISNALDISVDTVNFHLKNCMRKLDAPSKGSAAAYAIAYGLL